MINPRIFALCSSMKKSKNFHRKEKNFRGNVPSSLATLQCILIIYGLNISLKNNKLRNRVIWTCNKITIEYIILCITVIFGRFLNFQSFPKDLKKYFIPLVLVETSSILLWCVCFFSKYDIAKTCKSIATLKEVFKTQHPDRLLMFFVFLSFLKCFLNIVSDMYPFTDQEYEKIFSIYFIPTTDYKYFNIGIAFMIVFIHNAFIYLLPQIFISLSITVCYHIHIILNLYIKANNVPYEQGKLQVIEWLDYYSFTLHIFQAFESTVSKGILIVFFGFFAETLVRLLFIIQSSEIFFNASKILFNIISITSLIFIASNVHEADKLTKQINLRNLHIFFKKDECFQNDKIIKLWWINKSPAFTLTAWGLFSIKKDIYLNIINVIIPYTLLVLNL